MISAEIMNWTGQLTVAPRSQLAQLSKREGIRRSGVYFLIGSNPKDPAQEKVYIGESDNIWTRLILHNKDVDKEFWEKTIIVTSKDENLTKAQGQQQTIASEREVKQALHWVLLRYPLHKEQELFDKAYRYIKEYY